MTDALPTVTAISMQVIAIAYFLAVHSPVLLALVIAWRQRRTMQRRILFVATVMGATYGFLVVFLMSICVPVAAFMVFIAPTLNEQDDFKHSVLFQAFLKLADFVADGWVLLLPFMVLIPALFRGRQKINPIFCRFVLGLKPGKAWLQTV
jgi:glycopeptide antibiotics resistance protein